MLLMKQEQLLLYYIILYMFKWSFKYLKWQENESSFSLLPLDVVSMVTALRSDAVWWEDRPPGPMLWGSF